MLALPESWRLIDPETEAGEARLRNLIADRPEWAAATLPLGKLDEDLSFLFLAQGQVPAQGAGRAQAVVVVARSQLLNRLAPREIADVAADLAADSQTALIEAELIAAVPGLEAERVALVVDSAPAAADEPLRCRQQLVPGRLSLLLVSTCSRPDSRYQSTVERIIGSFQRLAP